MYVYIVFGHGILTAWSSSETDGNLHPSPHPVLDSSNTRRKVPNLLHMNLQVRHRLLIPLRLPVQGDLIDMLFPERHLLPVRKPNPILQSVGVQGEAPECPVFYLGDAKVDCFAAVGGGVLEDDSYDAGWEEVVRHLTGEDLARPI